jgi:hypothetical protein
MKNGNRWYLASFTAAALSVAGVASAASGGHTGSAFPVAPLTTDRPTEPHVGEAGPAPLTPAPTEPAWFAVDARGESPGDIPDAPASKVAPSRYDRG